MLSRLALLAFVVVVLGTGCRHEVGDSCLNDAECDSGQTCDTASPGGYCLEYDCLPNACPDEAVCVDFTVLSACMRRCDRDSDCRQRDDYVCRDDIGSVPFCYTAPAI